MAGLRDFAMLNPVDTSEVDSTPNSSDFPPDPAFPPDAFPPDTGPKLDPVSPAEQFPPSTSSRINSVQADTNSQKDKNLQSDSFTSNVKQRDSGLPSDTPTATDPGFPLDPLAPAETGFPIDPLPLNPGAPIDTASPGEPFPQNLGTQVDTNVPTEALPLDSGMPVDQTSGTDPFAPEPGTPVDPNFQGDPFAGDPFAGDPFAGDPSGGDPFAGDPSAGDPFAGDPFAPDATTSGGEVPTITNDSPLFRFLPSMPTGNQFINLNDGTTNTFQPTENWIGEPLGIAKLEPNALDPTDPVFPGTPVSNVNAEPAVPSTEVGIMPAVNTPMSPEVVPGAGQHTNVIQNEVIPVQEGQFVPVSLDPMASPDSTNITPDISRANGPVVDPQTKPLGPVVEPNAIPLGPVVNQHGRPLVPVVDQIGIPLGPPIDSSAIPFEPTVDSNAVPVGPAVDQNAIPLGPAVAFEPAVDLNPIPFRPMVDSNAIPLGPIFATPVKLNPVGGGQNQNQDHSPGSSAQVPNNWMQLYTRDRKRPRKRPAVQQEQAEPIPLSPTNNLLAQASINSFTRNRSLYRRLREERRLARKQRREERKKKQQQQQQQNQRRQVQKQQRKQTQRLKQQNRAGRGRIIVSTGPKGAKVARMIIPGRNRPFVGKYQRGRRMVEPCTRERRRLGLCAPDQLPPGEVQATGVGQHVDNASGQHSGKTDHGGQPVNGVQIIDPLLGAPDHGSQSVGDVQITDSQLEPPLGYRGRGVRNPQGAVQAVGATRQHIGNAQGEGQPVQLFDPQHEPSAGYNGRGGRNSLGSIQSIGSGQPTGTARGQLLIGITDHGGLPVTDGRQVSPLGYRGRGQRNSLGPIETFDAGQHIDNAQGTPLAGINNHRGQPDMGVQVTDPQHERPLRNKGRRARNRGKLINKDGRQGNARNWKKQRKNKMKGREGKLINMRPNMQNVGLDFLPLENSSGIQHVADILDPFSGIPLGTGINQEPQGILEPVMPRNARNRRKQRKNKRKGKKGKLIKMTPNMQDVGPDLLPLGDQTGIQHSADVWDPVSGMPSGQPRGVSQHEVSINQERNGILNPAVQNIQPSADVLDPISGMPVGTGINRGPQGMPEPVMPRNARNRKKQLGTDINRGMINPLMPRDASKNQNKRGKGKKLEKAQKVVEPLNNVSLNSPHQDTVFDSQMTDIGKNQRKINKQRINRRDFTNACFFIQHGSIIAEVFSGQQVSIAEVFSGQWGGIAEVFSGQWVSIAEVFSGQQVGIAEVFSGQGRIAEVFSGQWVGIAEVFSGQWVDIAEVFSGQRVGIAEVFSGQWVGIAEVFSGQQVGIAEVFSGQWVGIAEVFSGQWIGIAEIFSGQQVIIAEVFSGQWVESPCICTFFSTFGTDNSSN
ncbi:uncharacterized protein LOC128558353 [Mercenaria mercenaria]|uniref:uncharacterized protein LOC128558353 n=1 Tax=Mercenaria mercenaria TaxID=6596 RepID=UPI00234F1082|nr:uncharacterized protein LOC128558353 [Mercenaria mercenaria]